MFLMCVSKSGNTVESLLYWYVYSIGQLLSVMQLLTCNDTGIPECESFSFGDN
jgi:hypothetical protein